MNLRKTGLTLEFGFMLYPVRNFERAIQAWQSRSFVELWRTSTVSSILGHESLSKAQIMVEDHPDEHQAGLGPVFIVNDLEIAESAVGIGADWINRRCKIPMGIYSIGMTKANEALRLLELSSAHDLGERAEIFHR